MSSVIGRVVATYHNLSSSRHGISIEWEGSPAELSRGDAVEVIRVKKPKRNTRPKIAGILDQYYDDVFPAGAGHPPTNRRRPR